MQKNLYFLMVTLLIFYCTSFAAQLKSITDPATPFSLDLTVEQSYQLYMERISSSDLIVVDVRTPGEFSNGHLEKALNINVSDWDFDTKIKQVDMKKAVLVYCGVGGRSKSAIVKMKALGFLRIFHMTTGYSSWASMSYPTVK